MTYAHPQVADEVLRIAMGDPKLLTAVGLDVCSSRLDLELGTSSAYLSAALRLA